MSTKSKSKTNRVAGKLELSFPSSISQQIARSILEWIAQSTDRMVLLKKTHEQETEIHDLRIKVKSLNLENAQLRRQLASVEGSNA